MPPLPPALPPDGSRRPAFGARPSHEEELESLTTISPRKPALHLPNGGDTPGGGLVGGTPGGPGACGGGLERHLSDKVRTVVSSITGGSKGKGHYQQIGRCEH